MTFLQDELWLHIIEYCEPKHAWLSLKRVNQQTAACVVQHFAEAVLPDIEVCLQIALPTYDIRQRLQGQAVFCYDKSSSAITLRARIFSFDLAGTQPASYQTHFEPRWKAMIERPNGSLDENPRWHVKYGGRAVRLRLKGPVAQISPPDVQTGAPVPRLSFEWPAVLSSFFLAG
ncbi:hypothetical protein Tdes44962_MAKER03772 [Teratosphaeria destructans]|uniref:F-box domain-containing protein n=1 Tax=Teratosphaeria destructans TaxID=418781 RepID=A0A9W7W1B1_9PEZI|nr:hypothetical protein Tdes44962_MAKER03772 [Teratosphaeria destructans]